jgi:ribosomal protein L21E
MGKKSRATRTSNGERNNVRRDIIKLLRREYLDNKPIERINNKMSAFKKGKNVMVTIPNPNTNETNKRFIRVNANTIWKSDKSSMMKQNTSESV